MTNFRCFALLLLTLSSQVSFGQLFYFDETETTLFKTTDQSPAHWYIEIFTNSPVDTILEWKADFSNIPAEWVINLDCQTVWFPVVNDQDEGTFVFLAEPDFPQKIIIGAMLNETTGTGSTYFTIRDPHNPSYSEQIAFHFVISQGTAEVIESDLDAPFSVKNHVLFLNQDVLFNGTISDVTGRTLLHIDSALKEVDLRPYRNELLFISLKTDINQHFFVKILPQ
jgi:hypothetical protein